MSEYQYYEFRAIDRPLTEEEQRTIGKLSSRVNLSPTQAIFVYHYSDFPANAEEILARYFDAMLYMANWGSCQLMFRFPKTVIDLEQVRPYCPPYDIEEFMPFFVSFTEKEAHVVLNIEWHEEGGWGWIEGEGWLPRLMGLRDDILRGDYRLLYLAWLKAVTLEDMLDEVEEPKAEQAKQAAAARARHLKKMETLAAQEAQIWQEVFDLIERKTGKAYDQATEHLADLYDLANHQSEQATFQARLNTIYRDYRNRPALLRRLRQAKLYEL